MTYNIKFFVFFFLVSVYSYGQLGFCNGSKGDPLFTENFGNGTTYGPALPAGITTYPFIAGAPNDGFYTLFYHSSFFQPSWHYSLDHTPDATNGPNGKMLLVNANAATSGDFYKKTISGLCVNTTFEFSAWVLNVYNPTSNICVNEIPINVRFEIWNATETVLLGSGNTGNIFGTPTPIWQQFALVFTTSSETSVVLKMKNNGVGGCGNDLAIDDISFSACADLTTISSPSVTGTTYTTCSSPVSLQLNASTVSAVPYFYQWQSSTDGVVWTDIPGENNATLNTPNLTSLTYFRVRSAQDLANLANVFCSTVSNIFTIDVLASPNSPVNDGDKAICLGDPIPVLSVTTQSLTGVNWYSAASGGTLLQANSATYTPAGPGTFYAEAYNLTTNCIASPRTPVSLSVVTLPDVTITGSVSVCSGSNATISFTGTPNALVTYSEGVNIYTINLNSSGTASFTQPYTATTVYALVSVALGSCSQAKNDTVTVTVNNTATASFTASASAVCSGSPVTLNFTGTPNATIAYSAGSASQTVALNGSGIATFSIPNFSTTTVFTLNSVSIAGICSQSLSQTITVTAVPAPTATISANPSVICSNQSAVITFSGTPNAVVTYKIDSGANQTKVLDALGTATIAASGLSSNTTYTLISVTSPDLNTCTTALSDSATITVNALPTASVSSNAPVCSGSSATVTFTGTPNATVNYLEGSVNQSIVLSGSGVGVVIVPNLTAAVQYTLVDVTSAGANGCTSALSQSISVVPVTIPTAAISANPLTICSNQTSTITFTGTPNAVVTFTDGSGSQTITLNAVGSATIATSSGGTYNLVSVASPVLASCIAGLTGSVTISVNSLPTASFSSNVTSVCNGGSAILTFNGTPGATVNYLSGSTSQSVVLNGLGTASVALSNITATSTYTLNNVVSSGANGCVQQLSQSVTITAIPALAATLTANPSVICSGQSSTLTINGTPNSVVTYTGASGNQTVNLGTSGVATVDTGQLSANAGFQLIGITLSGCSKTLSDSVTVSVNATPNVSYSGDLVYCEGEQVSIGLSSSIAGTTFNWTVSQIGTSGATSGTGSQILQSPVLTGSTPGSIVYLVTPVNNGCAGTPVAITVTIQPLPNPQITDGVICTSGSGPIAPYILNTNLSAATHTFQWFFEGNPIPNAFGNSYSANLTGTYSVVATNLQGCASDLVSAVVGEMPQGESLVLNQSQPFADNPMVSVTVVGGGGPFFYQLDQGAFHPTNTFYNLSPGEHTVTVIDENCTHLTAVFFIFDYPKYFTPNGDGFHETWNIGVLENATISIFDRYGKLLKQINSSGSGWDGTYNGEPVPSSDYWFAVDYAINGASKSFRAHFSLKR